MSDGFERKGPPPPRRLGTSPYGGGIRGGAGPFEAAAVVAVVNRVLELERAARSRRPPSNRPPAWMRAGQPRDPDDPLDVIVPDHRGDPL